MLFEGKSIQSELQKSKLCQPDKPEKQLQFAEFGLAFAGINSEKYQSY